MPKSFYTLLIFPKKSSAAKKISLSGALLKGTCVFTVGVLVLLMYFSYDYIHIRREQAELKRLKLQTAEQKLQIEGLVAKVEQFAVKLDLLGQYDKKLRIMANLVTGKKEKEQYLGIGGPASEESRLRSRIEAGDRSAVAALGRQVDRLLNDAQARERSFEELLSHLRERKSLLAATPSVWPVIGWVTSEFGRRTSPFSGEPEFHKAIDIATRMGKPIQAPADGVVVEVAFRDDMGQMVRIDHGHGLSTLYGHLSKAAVRVGATVRRGDRIGHVGNTGRSTGSHLHYAVWLNGVPVNPRKYLN